MYSLHPLSYRLFISPCAPWNTRLFGCPTHVRKGANIVLRVKCIWRLGQNQCGSFKCRGVKNHKCKATFFFFAANCTFVGSTTLHYLSLEVSNSAYLRKSMMSTCIGAYLPPSKDDSTAQGRQHCISSTQQASGWQPLPINRLQSSHLLHEPGLCRQQHWQ